MYRKRFKILVTGTYFSSINFFIARYVYCSFIIIIVHVFDALFLIIIDVLFGDKTPPPSKLELEERKLTAFNNFASMHTGLLCQMTGVTLNNGFITLLQILQNPALNKQVNLRYFIVEQLLIFLSFFSWHTHY